MTKLRDYFDEMVVYKDLRNNSFFSSLGLPAFLRDYLLKIVLLTPLYVMTHFIIIHNQIL